VIEVAAKAYRAAAPRGRSSSLAHVRPLPAQAAVLPGPRLARVLVLARAAVPTAVDQRGDRVRGRPDVPVLVQELVPVLRVLIVAQPARARHGAPADRSAIAAPERKCTGSGRESLPAGPDRETIEPGSG